MKRLVSLLLAVALLAGLCSSLGCGANRCRLDGTPLTEYSIVYAKDALDYTQRAAMYVHDEILSRTGLDLPVVTDDVTASEHEIIVGETTRTLSKTLDAKTEGMQFAIVAADGSVALEAEYFVIAAAAYYFIESYVTGKRFDSTLPSQVLVAEPITAQTKNVVLLIGDGMGQNQVALRSYFDMECDYDDGEDFFYGELFPYQGTVHTNSLSGLTDSAAAGTALATGFKTYNEYVGIDQNKQQLLSLPELFLSLGKGAGVMSTESSTGATPSAFSAHTDNRDNATKILDDQFALELAGAKIVCGFDYYSARYMKTIDKNITDTLDAIDDKDGFFLMYEEAHIDKHCHSNDLISAYRAVVRFNQAIGRFMEYAFYHPGTLVIITADHETGGLTKNSDGSMGFTTKGHSAVDVPLYAFGMGGELFDGIAVENVQIPKTIADLIGVGDFGDPTEYPSLLDN